MEFFKSKLNIAFMEAKWKTFIFSALMITLSIVSLFQFGLNLSLDFTGGTQVELTLKDAENIETVRTKVNEMFPHTGVQSMGHSKQYLLRLSGLEHGDQASLIESRLKTIWSEIEIKRVVAVGPQIGKDLFINGLNALIFALLATMLYICLRFESKFAFSATIALLHDPIITLGIFSVFGIEFDVVSLAGVLTVLGYSLNDTVVVYDRIRENHLLKPQQKTEITVNEAINETLSRTIITSLLTLSAVLALCLFGGSSLWGFSLSLAIGIVVGTYSSIYVAGALAVVMGLKFNTAENKVTHMSNITNI